MNAIAALGRRVIERVRGNWDSNHYVVADFFSMPDLAWRKAVYLSDVPCWVCCPC